MAARAAAADTTRRHASRGILAAFISRWFPPPPPPPMSALPGEEAPYCSVWCCDSTSWAPQSAPVLSASAQPCPDVEVVFARGTYGATWCWLQQQLLRTCCARESAQSRWWRGNRPDTPPSTLCRLARAASPQKPLRLDRHQVAPWYRARRPPRRRGTAAPTRTERVRSAAPNLLLSQHQRTRRYGVPSPGNADIPRRRRRFEKPTANERRVNAPRSVSADHVISAARAAMAANGIRAGQDLGLSWIYLLAQRISRQIMLAASATPGIDGKFVVVRLRRFQSCRGHHA